MSTYDSADLLTSFNEKSGRPSADAITDIRKYARLSKSQNRVIGLLSAVAPASLYPTAAYGSLPTLTTVDNQIFTFGNDANGYPVFPMGKGGIYASLNDIPDYPLVEGRDYIREGTQIRIPHNQTRAGPLFWYGVTNPPDIDATHQPSLFPEASRELIVIDAVRQFAGEGSRNPSLADDMAAEWMLAWPQWCLVWKTQFRRGGALSITGRQLALAGQL